MKSCGNSEDDEDTTIPLNEPKFVLHKNVNFVENYKENSSP